MADRKSKEDQENGDQASLEGLVETQEAFDAFVADRTEAGYVRVLRTFVSEAMSTRRCAGFPMSQKNLEAFLTGQGPFAPSIVRNEEGLPFLVFLTGHEVENRGPGVAAFLPASEVLVNAIKEEVLAGIAINPWTKDGVCLTKDLLASEIERLGRVCDH